ncbi:MAG: QueT transporter family protein [Phascolarctobacterium sp.]|nr:QueT transporter family protein [Phascolarctobacterium sp.]
MNNNRKLAISAMAIALYVVVMMCTQSFAFGQYQVRIATSLYGLSALFPFLVVPMGIANVLSNTIMGGLGILDMIGGFIVGILTTSLIVFGKKQGCGNWIIGVAVTFVPGLLVPVWLSYLLNIPYLVLASSLLIGQFIAGVAGVALVTALEKVGVGSVMFVGGNK